MNEILQQLRELKAITLLQAKEVLSVEDACTVTGLSKKYIYNMVQKRQIPHYRSQGGRLIFFRKEELNKWLLAVRVLTNEEIEAEAKKRKK